MDCSLNPLQEVENSELETKSKLSWPYPCSICDAGFNSRKDLLCHSEGEHSTPPGRPYMCEECRDFFLSITHLRVHKLTHGSWRKCLYCSTGFNRKDVLNKHVKRMHPEILLQIQNDSRCDLCKIACGSKKKLETHRKLKHGIETATPATKCSECGEVFLSHGHLVCHSKVHGLGYKCPHCPGAFLMFRIMKQHISRAHPQERRIRRIEQFRQCEFCKMYCESDLELSKHCREKHSEEERTTKKAVPNQDSKRKRETDDQRGLAKRIMKDPLKLESDADAECEGNIIGVQVVDVDERREKASVGVEHTFERDSFCLPHRPGPSKGSYLINRPTCEECGDTFTTFERLSVHKTFHEGQFMCSHCEARFRFKASLDLHMKRVHFDLFSQQGDEEMAGYTGARRRLRQGASLRKAKKRVCKAGRVNTSRKGKKIKRNVTENEIDSDDERFLDKVQLEDIEIQVKLKVEESDEGQSQSFRDREQSCPNDGGDTTIANQSGSSLLESPHNYVNLDDIKFEVEYLEPIKEEVGDNLFL